MYLSIIINVKKALQIYESDVPIFKNYSCQKFKNTIFIYSIENNFNGLIIDWLENWLVQCIRMGNRLFLHFEIAPRLLRIKNCGLSPYFNLHKYTRNCFIRS